MTKSDIRSITCSPSPPSLPRTEENNVFSLTLFPPLVIRFSTSALPFSRHLFFFPFRTPNRLFSADSACVAFVAVRTKSKASLFPQGKLRKCRLSSRTYGQTTYANILCVYKRKLQIESIVIKQTFPYYCSSSCFSRFEILKHRSPSRMEFQIFNGFRPVFRIRPNL